MNAADELSEVRIVHDVADRVPRVIRGRRVIEEEQDSGKERQRYGEEHRGAKGVEPGAALGNGLVEEVLEHSDYPRAVLHPVNEELARLRRLGSYPADHARGSLSRPRRVVACPGGARC